MDRVLCGMRWSRCLAYLDNVISFVADAPEAFLGTYRGSGRVGL